MTKTMAPKTMLDLIADAVIRLARQQCEEKRCGISYAKGGTANRHNRCAECPLDAVDQVVDELANSR